MADRSLATAASDAALKRSRGGWLALLGLLTLVAGAAGGLSGTFLVSKAEKAVEEKKKSEVEEPVARTVATDANVGLTSLGTIVTNLAGPGEVWIRLESAIVVRKDTLPADGVAVAEIRQDVLAYLRTLSVSQIESPSGLQHLREDLAERVALRTGGKVREFFIETLVVQ